MKLTEQFQQYIIKEKLFTASNRLLLAVSGGVDSVVMSELCHQTGFSFAIAHCNFMLRGDESTRDENFVKALASHYQVECFNRRFETAQYASENKLSIQVAARALRYNWFHELIKETPFANEASVQEDRVEAGSSKFDFILTAHHADDNVETMLMNFFKGTGIAGLRGILPKQGKLIRPLLFCRKEAIHAFAAEKQLGYVEDASNSSEKYTRNYFRNQLIPALEKVFPSVTNNLIDNQQRFREIELLYHQAIDMHKKKIEEVKGSEIHLPVLKLKKVEPLETVLYEIIKPFGFTAHQVKDVIHLLDSETGKFVRSAEARVIRNRNWLIIAPAPSLASNLHIIEEGTKQQLFQHGVLELKHCQAGGFHLPADNKVAALDASQVSFPLLLRRWKQGDYFYPLGMKKKKKLSRFFTDQKLSATAKENTWVIEMNKKIVWVIGHRIDDRFKIQPSTKNVLLISFAPNKIPGG